MLVSDFVPAVGLKATGKIPTFTTGSTKWLKILAIGNFYIRQWQDEPNIDWASLYSPDYTIATVTATASFTIPAAVRKISLQEGNVIRITHVDGVNFTDYTIVDETRLKEFSNYSTTYQAPHVIVTGSTLRFNRAFASTDPQFGGTIKAPVYLFAGTITADSDVIPVDIPNWLIAVSAAEYVRTDVTRQNQYPNLVGEANQIMEVMKSNNDAQDTSIYKPWNPTVLTDQRAFD